VRITDVVLKLQNELATAVDQPSTTEIGDLVAGRL
jgi:hypothetical protein